MNDEIEALNRNETWDKFVSPKGKKVVGCKWVFYIKYKTNGSIDR